MVNDTSTVFKILVEPINCEINIPSEISLPLTLFFSASEGSVSTEDIALPFVKALSEFRDDVRTAARELKAHDILNKCDNLRDNVLPELGVRLEDREVGEPAVFKVF